MARTILLVAGWSCCLASVGLGAHAALNTTVKCTEDRIEVVLNTDGELFTDVYLENLKGFPLCKPVINDNLVRFDVDLRDEFRCGTSRITNELTGERTYLQRIILEQPNSNNASNSESSEKAIVVQCSLPAQTTIGNGDSKTVILNRVRRQSLPNWPDIVEPDHINITEYIEARAPIPNLDLGIKQNGRMLDTAHSVQPGTPLEMVIYLDPVSKATYGILASFLKVSDSAGKQEEVIVVNGCSVDPYIFSNFITPDGGDTLSAAFKAFKFPDSNYVMFSGTVSICINQCKGVPCGNDQFGYGRRRRRRDISSSEISPRSASKAGSLGTKDPNAVYSVDMTTMLRVAFNDDAFTLQKSSLSAQFNNSSKDSNGNGTLDRPATNEESGNTTMAKASSSNPATFPLASHGMQHVEGVDISPAEEFHLSSAAPHNFFIDNFGLLLLVLTSLLFEQRW